MNPSRHSCSSMPCSWKRAQIPGFSLSWRSRIRSYHSGSSLIAGTVVAVARSLRIPSEVSPVAQGDCPRHTQETANERPDVFGDKALICRPGRDDHRAELRVDVADACPGSRGAPRHTERGRMKPLSPRGGRRHSAAPEKFLPGYARRVPRGRPPKSVDPTVSSSARLGAEIRARRVARGL